jgi:membrane dipeptidase
MFPNDVLYALSEKDGIFGMGAGVRTDKHPEGGISAHMEHLEFCIELIGIDHVGCGPDTVYGDQVGHNKAFQDLYKSDGYGHHLNPKKMPERKYPSVDYIRGLENPSEGLKNVTRWLIKNGYSDDEIAKIIGENALRLLKKVWKS